MSVWGVLRTLLLIVAAFVALAVGWVLVVGLQKPPSRPLSDRLRWESLPGLTVLADSAMHGDQLDEEAARIAEEAARKQIEEAKDKKSLEHAQLQLAEAAARYRAVQKLKGKKTT